MTYAESQTQEKRRTQKTGELQSDTNSTEQSQALGHEIRGVNIGAGRANWTGRIAGWGGSLSDRKRILGGIARQVSYLRSQHLAYVKSHQERLEARLQESRDHEVNVLNAIAGLEEQIALLLEECDPEQDSTKQ
ncbi:MAG: hypothetical protein F6J87_18240 [Spirulina sp. SIO3F2]|nr:hypothetical protein [Spirulina sp. SIO3F2]